MARPTANWLLVARRLCISLMDLMAVGMQSGWGCLLATSTRTIVSNTCFYSLVVTLGLSYGVRGRPAQKRHSKRIGRPTVIHTHKLSGICMAV